MRPRWDTQSRPQEALDRCAGVTGAVGTARNTRHHSWSQNMGVGTPAGMRESQSQTQRGFKA